MNSRGDWESPWKIPCFISTLPEFWLFEVSSIFQRHMAYCKRFYTLLAILNVARHSMIQECGTILYTSWQSIQHIAKIFLLFAYFRKILPVKIKSLVPQAPFLHSFCSSVKTHLSSNDSYIYSCNWQTSNGLIIAQDRTFTKVFVNKYSLAPNHPVWDLT